jgi:hypothetical protein
VPLTRVGENWYFNAWDKSSAFPLPNSPKYDS